MNDLQKRLRIDDINSKLKIGSKVYSKEVLYSDSKKHYIVTKIVQCKNRVCPFPTRQQFICGYMRFSVQEDGNCDSPSWCFCSDDIWEVADE